MNQGPTSGGPFAPAFGNFMNDQTAQMGFQLGQHAAKAGQEYVEQNVRSSLSSFHLKFLFTFVRTDL